MAIEETADEKNQREILYEAIQSSINERDDLEGSVLLGFAIIAEWQAPDGHKWLTKLSGDMFGELPPWRERMFGNELTVWEAYSQRCPECERREEEGEEDADAA